MVDKTITAPFLDHGATDGEGEGTGGTGTVAVTAGDKVAVVVVFSSPVQVVGVARLTVAVVDGRENTAEEVRGGKKRGKGGGVAPW